MSYSSYSPGGSGSFDSGGGGYGGGDMSASEQQAAQQRVQEIQTRMQVQKLVGKITLECFDKCHTRSNIGSADTKCMERCAKSYIAATQTMMKVLQGQ